jgi:O-antigen ligase
VGVLFLAAQRDWRVKTLIFNPPSLAEIKGILSYNEMPLLNLANRLAFFERMLYWLTGLRTFNQHPWLGVGLGNAGFYLPQNLPALGYYSYEIREVLYRLSTLPNVKNLWIRLLAETGIVGFSVFCLWLYNAWRSARQLYKAGSPILRLVALMGQFSLLAFIGEGFSIDSFAMPYVWVFTGLISAAAFIYRQQIRQAESGSDLSSEKAGKDQAEPEIKIPKLSPTKP